MAPKEDYNYLHVEVKPGQPTKFTMNHFRPWSAEPFANGVIQMKARHTMPFRIALPLPAFVLRPITAAVIAAVHVYLAAGHLSRLFGGEVEWTHMWKGFGALAGAYVFTALALRGLAQHKVQHLSLDHKREAQQNRLLPVRLTAEYLRAPGVWMVATRKLGQSRAVR